MKVSSQTATQPVPEAFGSVPDVHTMSGMQPVPAAFNRVPGSQTIAGSLFVASAVLTPPDPVSQAALAVPLIALFYLSILVAKILGYGNPD